MVKKKDKKMIMIVAIAVIAIFVFFNYSGGKDSDCLNARELYSTPEEASAASDILGCTGYHQHESYLPGDSYMACENHEQPVDMNVACSEGLY